MRRSGCSRRSTRRCAASWPSCRTAGPVEELCRLAAGAVRGRDRVRPRARLSLRCRMERRGDRRGAQWAAPLLSRPALPRERHPGPGPRALPAQPAPPDRRLRLRARADRARARPPRRPADRSQPGDAAQRLARASRIHAQHGNRRLDVGLAAGPGAALGPAVLPSPREAARAVPGAERLRPARADPFPPDLRARQRHAEAERRAGLRTIEAGLLAAMAAEEHHVRGLVRRRDDLLALTGASGAAVVADGRLHLVGITPGEAEVGALADWLAGQESRDLLRTDALATLFPPAAAYPDLAAGLLAVSISQIHPSYVLWFRPELAETVRWAGDPAKAVEPGTRAAASAQILRGLDRDGARPGAALVRCRGGSRTGPAAGRHRHRAAPGGGTRRAQRGAPPQQPRARILLLFRLARPARAVPPHRGLCRAAVRSRGRPAHRCRAALHREGDRGRRRGRHAGRQPAELLPHGAHGAAAREGRHGRAGAGRAAPDGARSRRPRHRVAHRRARHGRGRYRAPARGGGKPGRPTR